MHGAPADAQSQQPAGGPDDPRGGRSLPRTAFRGPSARTMGAASSWEGWRRPAVASPGPIIGRSGVMACRCSTSAPPIPSAGRPTPAAPAAASSGGRGRPRRARIRTHPLCPLLGWDTSEEIRFTWARPPGQEFWWLAEILADRLISKTEGTPYGSEFGPTGY